MILSERHMAASREGACKIMEMFLGSRVRLLTRDMAIAFHSDVKVWPLCLGDADQEQRPR